MLGRLLDFFRVLLSGRGNRDIFKFWDGKRTRYIDPWAVYRASREFSGFSWETTIPAIVSEAIPGDTGDLTLRLQAISDAAKCARFVFSLPEFDDGGLTEKECLDLLIRFERYVLGVKKNGSSKQTSPESVEPIPEATKVVSESGSTETASEHSEDSGQPKEPVGQ